MLNQRWSAEGRSLQVLRRLRSGAASPMVHEYILLASSTAAVQVANLFVNLAGARALGPSGYGLWNLLTTAVGYLSFVQFGVTNGLAREIPLARGAQELDQVQSLRNAAAGCMAASSFAGCVILVAISWSGLLGPIAGGTVAMTAWYFVAYQIYTFVYTCFQADARFGLVARLQFLLAATAALALGLIYWWMIDGLIFGQGLAFAVFALAGWRFGGMNLKLSFTVARSVELVRVGLPIMMVSIGYMALTTIDRWVVLRYLGLHAVGRYSLQIRLVMLPLLFVTLVANQFYPRLAEEFGRSRSIAALRPLLRVQIMATFALSIAAGAALWLLLPTLVRIVWPHFDGGLEVVPVMLVSMVLLAQCSVVGVFLNVVGKQRLYLTVQIAVLPVAAGLSVWLTKASGSIMGTAVAGAITYCIYYCGILAITFRTINHDKYTRPNDGDRQALASAC